MKQRIVFTGGGTGGHVFPALAIAEGLQQKGYDLVWLGSRKGMEYDIVRRWGLRFVSIPAGKLRRYFSFRNLVDVFMVAAGFFASIFVLLRLRPAVLFSKGGYVSVPPVYAAALLRIPVITHESDLDPGLATRLNAKVARIVCLPYPESAKFFSAFPAGRLRISGNPVRAEIFRGDAERFYQKTGLSQDVPLVFVQGGSQGAAEINNLLYAALPELVPHCCLVHQCGKDHQEKARSLLADNPEYAHRYLPQAFFIEDYPDILAAATLSVTRGGAGSLWELAAVGVPALIVPLRAGSRGDQLRNADYFASRKMMVVHDPNSDFASQVLALIQDESRLKKMQSALAALDAQSAVERLVNECEELI